MKKLLLIALLFPGILFCMKHLRDEDTDEIRYIDPKLLRHTEIPTEFTEYGYVMPNAEGGYQALPLAPLYLEVSSSDTVHICDACSKSFGSKGNLNIHIKTVHERQKPFKCEDCGHSFGQKGNLIQHIKTVHKKQRSFKCKYCKQNFGYKNVLNRHIKTVHEQQRPFKCEPCNKSFGQKEHLNSHIVRKHMHAQSVLNTTGPADESNPVSLN